MDQALNLSIALGGYIYLGTLSQWKDYAAVLTQGKVGLYKQSDSYRNQTLKNFFGLFRGLWDSGRSPMPDPEEFGLVPVRPENLSQAELIDALLEAS